MAAPRSGMFPENQSGILAAEGNAVRDRILEIGAAPLFRDVIEVAFGIGNVHVRRRREHAIAHGKQRCGDACGAARALWMTDQALERRSRQFEGVPAEGKLYSPGLDTVVQLGRSSVIIQIPDAFRRDSRFLHGEADRPGGLFTAFFEPHSMVSLAGRSVAGDFAQNSRAAGESPVTIFEDEEPRTLSDDESFSVARERTGSAFGIVVPP